MLLLKEAKSGKLLSHVGIFMPTPLQWADNCYWVLWGRLRCLQLTVAITLDLNSGNTYSWYIAFV